MLSTIEFVYDYFEDHVRLAAVVRERRPLAVGVLGFLIGGLSVFMAYALSNRLHLLSFTWTSLAVVVIWKVAAGFLLAALLHLILELQGLRGDAAALFIMFGLADLAWALAVPLVLLVKTATHSGVPVTIALMAVGFLTLSLKARSLQDGYRISSGRAWFMLGLPYLALVSAALLALSLLVLKLAMVLGGWAG